MSENIHTETKRRLIEAEQMIRRILLENGTHSLSRELIARVVIDLQDDILRTYKRDLIGAPEGQNSKEWVIGHLHDQHRQQTAKLTLEGSIAAYSALGNYEFIAWAIALVCMPNHIRIRDFYGIAFHSDHDYQCLKVVQKFYDKLDPKMELISAYLVDWSVNTKYYDPFKLRYTVSNNAE